jgi:hypothetical protein
MAGLTLFFKTADVEYGMKTAARSLDLVYIGFKTFGYSTNDKRLTIFNNQIK